MSTCRITSSRLTSSSSAGARVSRRSVRVQASNKAIQSGVAAAAAAAFILGQAPAMAASEAFTLAENPFSKIFNTLPKPAGAPTAIDRVKDALPSANALKTKEDPFGADQYPAASPGNSKNSIAIPTEQEAVAPEAFPAPNPGSKSQVLKAAASDEKKGPNADQFKGANDSTRQGLIDASSPN